jgi:hypothetical protein
MGMSSFEASAAGLRRMRAKNSLAYRCADAIGSPFQFHPGCLAMMRRSTFLPAAIASWSKHDLQVLRSLAHEGASIEVIAKTLKRTPSAIRNKAGIHGISLAPRPAPLLQIKRLASC